MHGALVDAGNHVERTRDDEGIKRLDCHTGLRSSRAKFLLQYRTSSSEAPGRKRLDRSMNDAASCVESHQELRCIGDLTRLVQRGNRHTVELGKDQRNVESHLSACGRGSAVAGECGYCDGHRGQGSEHDPLHMA